MNTNIAPSAKTYALVKAGFVAQGTTLNKFCQSSGLLRQNARQVCLGLRNGPKARALLARFWEASQNQSDAEFPAKSSDGPEFLTNKNQITD